MRAILLILILAIVLLIGAVATGFIDLTQTREARVPSVTRTDSGVATSGGQAPAFDVETGSVSVTTKQTNVTVPVPEVKVQPANENSSAAANDAAAAR
jgi:hypothetical protein